MLRMAVDADFSGRLFRALVRRQPDLDLIRVQDVGLRTALDPVILAWAAAEGRILLSNDKGTMSKHAYERVNAGLPMPGVFLLREHHGRIGLMVDAILLVAHCSSQEEWRDQVVYLPL